MVVLAAGLRTKESRANSASPVGPQGPVHCIEQSAFGRKVGCSGINAEGWSRERQGYRSQGCGPGRQLRLTGWIYVAMRH